jgi:hypothetical protein
LDGTIIVGYATTDSGLPHAVLWKISPTSEITIKTNPTGLEVIVDDIPQTSPYTFTGNRGEKHYIDVVSPQFSTPGSRHVFSSWSDGGAQGHYITVPFMSTTYTANFGNEYQLTTAVTPAGSGTVSPPSGNWYPAGSLVTLSALPAAGYAFTSWDGPVANSAVTPTTVTMNGSQTITANMGLSPKLQATLTGKLGLASSKVATVNLTNQGKGTAIAAQIDGLTITQTAGSISCTPVVNPNYFPLVVGNIAPKRSALANITIDFSKCTSNSVFTVTIPFSSNSGTYSGVSTFTQRPR